VSQPSSPSQAPPEPAWQTIAPHRYYAHGDVVFFECQGALNRPGIVHILDLVERLQAELGRVYLIIDASAAQPLLPEARQYALEWHRTHSTRGFAVLFGANVLVRAGVALVNAATRLLVRRDVVAEAFVKTEAEAWALICSDREKILAESAASAGLAAHRSSNSSSNSSSN
jgi:hypothetical protein